MQLTFHTCHSLDRALAAIWGPRLVPASARCGQHRLVQAGSSAARQDRECSPVKSGERCPGLLSPWRRRPRAWEGGGGSSSMGRRSTTRARATLRALVHLRWELCARNGLPLSGTVRIVGSLTATGSVRVHDEEVRPFGKSKPLVSFGPANFLCNAGLLNCRESSFTRFSNWSFNSSKVVLQASNGVITRQTPVSAQ